MSESSTKPAPSPTRHPSESTFTARQLMEMDLPPLLWVVDGLLPEGLTLLVGPPKVGKSWLALQIALAVAAGNEVLGGATAEGDVLYLALEDSPRRLQRRLRAMLAGTPPPENLHFQTRWLRTTAGGLEELESWLDSHPDCRLVIIDTLEMVRLDGSSPRQYANDYGALEPFRRLAADRAIALVAIHHTRKLGADDALDRVSGTQGLAGTADSILVLVRDGSIPADAVLYVTGRDLDADEVALSWKRDLCRWFSLGSAGPLRIGKERQQIRDVIEEAGEPLGPKDITVKTSGSPDTPDWDRRYDAVRQLLGKMVDDGQLEQPQRGIYRLPRAHIGHDVHNDGEPAGSGKTCDLVSDVNGSPGGAGGRMPDTDEGVAGGAQ